jgi:hypothetical protein
MFNVDFSNKSHHNSSGKLRISVSQKTDTPYRNKLIRCALCKVCMQWSKPLSSQFRCLYIYRISYKHGMRSCRVLQCESTGYERYWSCATPTLAGTDVWLQSVFILWSTVLLTAANKMSCRGCIGIWMQSVSWRTKCWQDRRTESEMWLQSLIWHTGLKLRVYYLP